MLINFQNEIITILTAASPFFELRLSLPVAVTVYKFSYLKAYLLSVVGNFLPVIPLLLFWQYLGHWLAGGDENINFVVSRGALLRGKMELIVFYLRNKIWSIFERCGIKSFFRQLFLKTRNQHENHFELWKDLALLVFVALPIPFTGAWTGTLAAFVFNVPLRQAAVMIGLGIMVAGLIVNFIIFTGSSLF